MYSSLLKQLLIAISMPPPVVFVMRSRLKIVNEEPKNSELYMAGFNHVSVDIMISDLVLCTRFRNLSFLLRGDWQFTIIILSGL